MKKGLFLGSLLLVICLLCGCSHWLNGSYSNVTPNHSSSGGQTGDAIYVSSDETVRNALISLVEAGEQKTILYATGLSEVMMEYHMDNAITYIKTRYALGAYAVEEITYEIGSHMGNAAISVDITYEHSRSEILQIKKAINMDEVLHLLQVALEDFQTTLVVRVGRFNNRDLVQYAKDYMDRTPQKCMEMPQMTISTYPETGTERVIEIHFNYQTSRDALRDMQQSVSDVFTSAQYYIDPDAPTSEKFAQLYSFLMPRYAYSLNTSITPSYSLLRHGVGDSKAFATVFSAMCRQVGLDCEVISGTRLGEAWHWNIVNVDNVYYYVDLLASAEEHTIVFKTQEEMIGYVWDFTL